MEQEVREVNSWIETGQPQHWALTRSGFAATDRKTVFTT